MVMRSINGGRGGDFVGFEFYISGIVIDAEFSIVLKCNSGIKAMHHSGVKYS